MRLDCVQVVVVVVVVVVVTGQLTGIQEKMLEPITSPRVLMGISYLALSLETEAKQEEESIYHRFSTSRTCIAP